MIKMPSWFEDIKYTKAYSPNRFIDRTHVESSSKKRLYVFHKMCCISIELIKS